MKTIILTLAIALLGITTFAQTNKQSKKTHQTIVIVPGAWSDPSAWAFVEPLLKAKGFDVITVNLPGHGKDSTSFANISLQSYVDAVKTAIGEKDNIILVGHSMAGIIISQVAEDMPGQIKKLVYVAAFLPKTGESLLTLAQTDADAHVGKYLQINKETGSADIAKNGIIDAFAADAPQPVQEIVVASVKAEPLAPLATPVNLTDARFGSVVKIYIHTLNDHTVSYKLQQKMVAATNVKKEYSLNSSHTPFLSMPDKLAEIISKEAK
ncbi:alpha/beta fold hydrolase [Mucilaginibacter aquaedulcis]|uniref:alpha/beta fold hydrolase n=1 Tax=Mucilaginibacter aquaedulcis TaxID=1187081 RepID=UPI0025B5561E|nr:alpha/beta hydrolase [Mucilaginibacter aquaedulcis]MDN3548859.1 alpha/beta hydrolase [Mucilaginibacter aquaedulcis]